MPWIYIVRHAPLQFQAHFEPVRSEQAKSGWGAQIHQYCFASATCLCRAGAKPVAIALLRAAQPFVFPLLPTPHSAGIWAPGVAARDEPATINERKPRLQYTLT